MELVFHMKKAMFMIHFESYQNEYYLIKFSKCIPASIDNCFDSNIFFFFFIESKGEWINISNSKIRNLCRPALWFRLRLLSLSEGIARCVRMRLILLAVIELVFLLSSLTSRAPQTGSSSTTCSPCCVPPYRWVCACECVCERERERKRVCLFVCALARSSLSHPLRTC